MRILLWHVHGSWTTSFVAGGHEYLLPTVPDRGRFGRGLPTTWRWPNAREVPHDRLRDEPVDVVVLQRTEELELAERWTGRRPGTDLPAVFVEHNTPRGDVPNARHFLADRADIPIAHVTHFNELFWDNGRAPTVVIEHGVADPGHRYTGELPRLGAVINEPLRRWRVTGTDLLPGFAGVAPVDVFGMKVTGLPDRLRADFGVERDQVSAYEDLPQREMHALLARRRAYVHALRWTSLGLSLVEAMQLGMPVVVLATTEAVEAVPPEAGVVSTRPAVLHEAARRFIADADWAAATGKRARAAALARYGLPRFLRDWDRLLEEVSR